MPPRPPHERGFPPHAPHPRHRHEEPTHTELFDALMDLRDRLDRIEQNLQRV